MGNCKLLAVIPPDRMQPFAFYLLPYRPSFFPFPASLRSLT